MSWSGGKVKCDLCGHEWIAVRPTETERLECPNCDNTAHYDECEQKRFANVKMILDFIKEHKDKIENLPATTIQLEKRDIEWGDEWDSETGYEYLIFFADNSAYLVGETTVIEDREDYAEADSWQQSHCRDCYQERGTVPCLEVLEKLEAVVL